MKTLRKIIAWPFMIIGATFIFIGCAINADTINFNSLTMGDNDAPTHRR